MPFTALPAQFTSKGARRLRRGVQPGQGCLATGEDLNLERHGFGDANCLATPGAPRVTIFKIWLKPDTTYDYDLPGGFRTAIPKACHLVSSPPLGRKPSSMSKVSTTRPSSWWRSASSGITWIPGSAAPGVLLSEDIAGKAARLGAVQSRLAPKGAPSALHPVQVDRRQLVVKIDWRGAERAE